MTQTLDSLPLEYKQRILCIYFNSTKRILIARISNIPGWYFERVVFPGEQLLFEAVPEAYLEIHTTQKSGTILTDKISCSQLQVQSTSSV
ncbi:MAG: DUF1830 domain-containing protein [Nostocaceae cyanobacterium]|nr:DUF1830 domain-containing protein [Nostocaceae cyanobacterium]